MSGPRSFDASTVEGMIEITERLTDLLADQARAFERHRPQDAAVTMAKVAQLTGLYRAGSARIQSAPASALASPPAARQRLMRATEAFEAVLERQTRAIAASKTVTEGLVRAIAEAIATRRASNAGYGPGVARRVPATAITLDRKA